LNLTASQERLRKLRDALGSTKENITKGEGDLSISLNRSQQYKEMLRLLDIMYISLSKRMASNKARERLQAVPDKIENLITEKHFTRAVVILSEAIRILNQPEFKNVGALQDVSAYLKNQETVFSL
jgi:exocyst complex component 4